MLKETKVTALNTSKITFPQMAWLKSIGWVVVNGWRCEGKEPVIIVDTRYTPHITDKRFTDNKKHWKNVAMLELTDKGIQT